MLVVSLLSPGLRNPTAFIGGQSSWVGTGSDATTCGRLSLLTNNTCPHALIRYLRGRHTGTRNRDGRIGRRRAGG